MATYRVTDPKTGRTVKLTGDSPPTEQELEQVFSSVSSATPPTSITSPSNIPNPMEFINQAKPSNLLKLAGVGSANAPGIAGTLINSLPGIGTASQIMPAIQNIQANPTQGKEALRRISMVNSGGALTPKEVIPANIGQVGGTLLEMMTPEPGGLKIKARGPFTAGLKDPSTALPGAFEKAGQALGKAKSEAGAGIDSPQVHKILRTLENPKAARQLLTEAREWVQRGMKFNISNAKALAYKQVLGEAQAEGGTFADVYAQGVERLSGFLAKRSPKLAGELENMATNFAARGNPKASFPFFTTALDPKIGLAKAATLPIVRNVAGAVTAKTLSAIPRALPVVDSTIDKLKEKEVVAEKLSKEKAKDFLKKAKGNKEKATQLAIDAGYDPYL